MGDRKNQASLPIADRATLDRYHIIAMYKKMNIWGRLRQISGLHLKQNDNERSEILQTVIRAYDQMIKQKSNQLKK